MAIILPPSPTPNVIAVAPSGSTSGGGPSAPFLNPAVTGLTFFGVGAANVEWEGDIPVWETPFETDPKPYIYRVLYQIKASAYKTLALYAKGPFGGQHVGESNFKTSKGGILSFSREFARKPDSRSEFESIVFPHQILSYSAIIGSSADLQTYNFSEATITEIPVTVPSRIQYDYFDTTSPTTVPLPKAPRVLTVGDVGYSIHGWSRLKSGDQMLAEDATLRIWRGRIYERRMRFVEFQLLNAQI